MSIGKMGGDCFNNKSENYGKMLTNPNFTFMLSVSKNNYPSKPNDVACERIAFKPMLLTVDAALESAIQGKAFCYNFQSTFDDGYLPIKQKNGSNYIGTSTIIYDFDKMAESMEDYIDSISYKPSFAYTSYRDGIDGFRFRLAYVFDNEIIGEQEFLKMYRAIGSANQFLPETKEHGGVDVRGCAQMYFGTHNKARTYKSDIVYSLSDFEKYTLTSEQHFSPKYTTSRNLNSFQDNVDDDFLNDLNNLPYGSFFKKYYDRYYDDYKKSLETELTLSENEMWFEFPDDYVSVYRKRMGKFVLKWEIGEDRKKKLYMTAQVMMYNYPNMTLENLIYNLVIERTCYYVNTDNKLDNNVLVQTAVNAFNKRIELKPSKHGSFRVNKEFWIEQGVTMNQAKNYIKYQKRVNEIIPYIDSSKSIKENHEFLVEMGFKISKRTLERMVTNGDIEIVNRVNKNTLLSDCRSCVTIQSQIIDLIKEDCYITISKISSVLGVSDRTIKRVIKDMRGKLIQRIGNNRSGYWVVLSDATVSEYEILEQDFEQDKTVPILIQPKSDNELR